MKGVEVRGRTVEEAVENGLRELGLSRDRVDVEIIEEPSRALFGILGGREAVVRVVPREDREAFARRFLSEVTEAMKVDVDMEIRTEDEWVTVDMAGQDAALLIGRRGQTLDALQYLVNVAAGKACAGKGRIVVDVEGYRKRRARTIERMAEHMAERVARTGKKAAMEPMTAHERKIVHLALQKNPRVSTMSEGEEPYRRVIITPE